MIPATQRPDGSWRKPIKIREGHQEVKNRYLMPEIRNSTTNLHKRLGGDDTLKNTKIYISSETRNLHILESQVCTERDVFLVMRNSCGTGILTGFAVNWVKTPDTLHFFTDELKAETDSVWKAQVDPFQSADVDAILENLKCLTVEFPTADARIVCSPSLSKKERAQIHHMAQDMDLYTQSHGIGDERFLVISGTDLTLSELRCRTELTPSQNEQAIQLWKWAQADQSGRFSSFSLGEVKQIFEMGMSDKHPLCMLRQEMMDLYEFHDFCKSGNISEVEKRLEQNRSLLWRRHPETDEVPLVEACKSRQQAIVNILLDAGADSNTYSRREGLPFKVMCEKLGLSVPESSSFDTKP